ncbi:MAG: flagellar hook capping FlgD N-terminal domain-containing protein [Chloroherpetonaceae bacterium]|nr:hypothetical protein [Chthonomonadaceae bacterium]MDW8209192.1 flagellar hook capping FlgD N-terminal domain-containing protein [Chloroherpetonaceae bacterium]
MQTNAIGSANVPQDLFQTQNRALGQHEFLKLLVTQLTNQDPLNPMDQEDFLAQMAQFATVEGVNNIYNSQTRLQASSLLGKRVEAFVTRDGLPVLITGKVNGVRWDSQGIFLSIEGQEHEVSLNEVSSVRQG